MDKEAKKKQGRSNRARGKAFELKVRADLEKQGWIVSKWANQVVFGVMKGKKVFKGEIEGEISQGHLIPAKSQYNPFFKRIIGEGSGFPDFIAFKQAKENLFDLIAVECKMGKYLSQEEKQKCNWLLSNGKFSKILIASPGEKKGQIIYEDHSQNSIKII